MSDKIISKLIQQLVENTFAEEKRQDLENQLKIFPKAYEEYMVFRADFINAEDSDEIADNPYLAARVRERLASDNRPLPVYRKVAWAPYAVLASLGISFGVFLGNQVSQSNDSSADFITEEFIVADYDTEDMYIVDFND